MTKRSSLYPLLSLAALAATVALAAAPGVAGADEPDHAIDRAIDQIGNLRYDDALSTLGKALASGTNSPAQTARLYMLLGEVHASMGQDDDAAQAFDRALVIDPSVELRKGLSPKIREPFADARHKMRGKRIEIAHRVLKRDKPTVAVVVVSDPLGMVVGARLAYTTDGGEQRSIAAGGKDRVDLELPDGVKSFVVGAIDEHGNRLAAIGSPDHPLSLDVNSGGRTHSGSDSQGSGLHIESNDHGGDGGGSSSSSGTPLYAHWAVWGGAALVLAGGGTWAGLSARSAQNKLDTMRKNSDMYEFSQVQAVADRAKSRALLADIGFAAAGACAVVSVVLYIRHHGKSSEHDSADEPHTALAPLVGSGRLGVAASIRF